MIHNLKIAVLASLLFIININISKGQGSTLTGQSNSVRVPIPAVPFLSIAPDARAAGMGDVGAATTPDAASTFWNPAKLAFIDNPNGASLSYTPWLSNLGISDMSLSYLSGYHRLDKNSTIAATINYFDLGYIQFTNASGADIGDYYSKEFSAGVSYARKLSNNIGVGVSIRYINSNLTGNQVINGTATKPGTSAAGDVSIYHSPKTTSGKPLTWAWGANISNLGGKINYGGAGDKYFIPSNFRLGTSANYKASAFNRLSVSVDMNKLMIPTPPERDPTTGKIIAGKSLTEGSALGRIFGSFADAPGGFSEEFKEITWSIGAEYAYKEQFLFRAGYFNENKQKGGRSYLTAGFGARFTDKYTFDFAYLFQPTQSGNSNPLNNTLRFSLGVFFDKKNKSTTEEPSLN
jgi:Type IX secretion system protein PorV